MTCPHLLQAIGVRLCHNRAACFGPARTWVSATPFVATRYPKRRRTKRDRTELLGPGEPRRLPSRPCSAKKSTALARRKRSEITAPTIIEPLPEQQRVGIRGLRPIHLQRLRRKASDDGGRRASGAFRIVFPAEIDGPLLPGTLQPLRARSLPFPVSRIASREPPCHRTSPRLQLSDGVVLFSRPFSDGKLTRESRGVEMFGTAILVSKFFDNQDFSVFFHLSTLSRATRFFAIEACGLACIALLPIRHSEKKEEHRSRTSI